MDSYATTLFHEFLHRQFLGSRSKYSEFWAEIVARIGSQTADSGPVSAAMKRIVELYAIRDYDELPVLFNGDLGIGMSLMTFLQE